MNYQKTYMNHIHSSSLLYQLSTMWKTQTLCDAIIRTGSVITKAHRVVLVAACPMLQSMENAAAGSHLEVRLAADIKQDSINTFLQYLYEGFMTLNEENYKDIEKISRLLQVENAIKCCADFGKCINVSSANRYRYNYPDQLEFKHVRTTELQKVQDRHPKRNTDRPISPGSKRPRFHGHPSPLSDSRTHDMSGMKESYSVNDPWDRVPRLGSHTPTSVHVPSQQPGVIDIVEDSIELLQTEPPSKRPGEESREIRKVQSTVGVSVASQRDAPSDVQIVSVPGASDVPSQKPLSEPSTFIPSSPSSSDSSSLKERPPHFSSQSYPSKTDLDKPTSNMDSSPNVDIASQRHRPPDILAGSQPNQPYPVSITASPRSVPQTFQQKPFAAGSAMQAETISPGAAQRGPKPQTISRVESMEKTSPMDRPPDTGSQTRDQNNRLSPDISIVKVENEVGPEETGILDMYVADAGGGGMGTSQGQKEEDQSDYDVEEPPGDMQRDDMSNESGNMSMDQSGNWYMGNFREMEILSQVDMARPGIWEANEAQRYGMVELAPNTSVYLYQKQYEIALSKIKINEKTMLRDGTPAARYLLSTFYSKAELVNATIRNMDTECNVYQGYVPLNKAIIYAIEGGKSTQDDDLVIVEDAMDSVTSFDDFNQKRWPESQPVTLEKGSIQEENRPGVSGMSAVSPFSSDQFPTSGSPSKFESQTCLSEWESVQLGGDRETRLFPNPVQFSPDSHQQPAMMKASGIQVPSNRSPSGGKNTPLQAPSFLCELCMASFYNEIDLQIHKSSVNHRGLYFCRWCSSSYSTKEERDEHVLSHADGRMFLDICIPCGKGFKSRMGYVNHVKMYHTKEGEVQTYRCEVCGKLCVTKSQLNVHMRAHSDQQNFYCVTCNKSFKHKFTLQRHNCPASQQ